MLVLVLREGEDITFGRDQEGAAGKLIPRIISYEVNPTDNVPTVDRKLVQKMLRERKSVRNSSLQVAATNNGFLIVLAANPLTITG